MSEPRFGYKNVVKMNCGSKVKAFFSLLIPTETFGTIEVAGFKLVDGARGLFISPPTRAVKKEVPQSVDASTGAVVPSSSEIKYYNNILFDSYGRYSEFMKELNDNVLPLLAQQVK